MAHLRLLLTGATGYIGGSILTTLLESKHESIRNLEISVLVRDEQKGAVLAKDGVISSIYFKGFDDADTITAAASEHDIVINSASGYHSGLARALILGLGQRKKETGKEVYYFHTTGTSNIADKPLTKDYLEPRILTDNDDLYSYLNSREATEPYEQRTTDLVAIDTGLEVNVTTHLIMSPTIYGEGSGKFHRASIQLPTLIRTFIKLGHAVVMGEGAGVWDEVHIADLTALYELLLAKVLAGEKIPSGKRGIYFSETGDFSWKQLSQGLADELAKQGLIKTNEVKSISLQEGADLWTDGDKQLAELAFGSNARSRAELSRKLGWAPKKTKEDFLGSFKGEVEVIAKEAKKA
ncbi:hypothetical protein V498_04532 [Pseudogymnoascus sp. VKM F-4517 (FW-2822)]|nr:hypothetical protein V498_04532 [Pseudogymnoascus sp. VKM F-4517 (FW-2822)]